MVGLSWLGDDTFISRLQVMNGSCLYDLWLPEFPICWAIFHVSHSENNLVQKQDKTTMLAAGSNGEIRRFEASLENMFGKNKCIQYKKCMLGVPERV